MDAADATAKTACEHMDSCAMYGLFKLTGTLAVWKTNYCNGEYGNCERFRRASRGEPVPQNLLPNGKLMRK